MKAISKKTIATLVAGTFILIGASAPFIAQAAETAAQRPVKIQRQIDPVKAADRMSAVYGVSKLSVLKYHAGGMSIRDLNHASFLALASGKSLNDVMTLKSPDNTWKDVSASLGLTQEQKQAAKKTAFVNGMNFRFNIDKQVVLDLMNDGKQPRDIAAAGWLAHKSGKTIDEVFKLKTDNKQWNDVAKDLGIKEDFFNKHNRQTNHLAQAKKRNPQAK